nr:DUF2809 domain-containing protein [Cohnella sp. WQ 127256]
MSSRVYADHLPDLVANHFGDALWASMIYIGVRLLFVNRSFFWAAGVSLIFCYGIEFSQLYQADWINGIRNTFLGGLVLGKGFVMVDLIRYLVGIAASLGLDLLNRKYSDQRM